MARKISTRIAIEGESQYRQAISQINAEQRKLNSALRLTESEYKSTANSLDALNAKSKALLDIQQLQTQKVKAASDGYENAQRSVQEYERKKEELTKEIEKNATALEKLKTVEGDTTEEQKKLTEETVRLQKEFGNNEARLDAAKKGVNNWEISLNTAKTQLNETNAAIQKNDQYLEEAKNSTDKCAHSIDEYGKETKKAKESTSSLGAVLISAGIVASLKKIADGFMACAKASIEFESAMTGVEKTTDLTDAELEAMADSIQKLSTIIPQTTTELAGIAETAGQLGIAKEYLLDFTRVMADLGVATNLTGEDAAQTFAKFANITGMAQSDFDRLGAAVVDLGNNLATTEADIANMAIRLAAAGTQAGLSEAQILGLAGAMSSVGLEADAGGTAFSKALNMISVAVETGNDNLADFAEVAGMSAGEFARAFREDAAGALVSFIRGLGNMESHGKSATLLLEELGLKEVRLRDGLTRAANSSDLFSESIQRGTNAWKENTALTREAELRYGTTESKLKMLSNSFNNVKIAVGNQLTPAIGKLADGFADLLNGVESFIEDNEQVVPILTAMAVSFGVLAIALVGYTLGTKAATVATEIFNKTVKTLESHPIFLVSSAVAALAAGIAVLVATMDDGSLSVKEMTSASREAVESLDEIKQKSEETAQSSEAAAAAAERYVATLEALENQGLSTNQEQLQYSLIVDELNNLIPELNLSIDEQTGLIKGGTEALRQNVSAWKEQAIQQGRMVALTETYQALGASEVELAQNQVALKKAQLDYDQASQAHQDIINRMNELLQIATEEAAALSEEYGETIDPLSLLTQEYYDLEKSLEGASDEAYTAQEQLNNASEAAEISADNLEILNAETANLEGALESLNGTLSNVEGWAEMSDAQKEQAATLQLLQSEQAKLQQAYDDTYESALNSVTQQIGLYDDFAYEVTMSAQEIMDTWQQQADNLNAYTENLAAAAEYVAPAIAEAWSDGTTESAAAVQAFMDQLDALIEKHGEDSDEVKAFVDDFNATYEETAKAKETFAETVAEMQTNFEDSMNAIQKKMDETIAAMNKAEAAAESANNTCDGYLDTMNARVGEFSTVGAKLAQAVIDAYNQTTDQHSPARVPMKSSENVVEGYQIPLQEGIQKLYKLGEEMATATTEGYDKAAWQMAKIHESAYAPQTNSCVGDTYHNQAHIEISVQQLTDADLQRIANFVDQTFGAKMTVTVRK